MFSQVKKIFISIVGAPHKNEEFKFNFFKPLNYGTGTRYRVTLGADNVKKKILKLEFPVLD